MSEDKVEKLCRRAREAIQRRDWDTARQTYLRVLGLRSNLPDVHYGLATVYFQVGELTSAAHHFREVTRLDPLRAAAYVNLGAMLNLLEQLDEAEAVLRRGIQLDPGRAEGYYNLGLVQRRRGQTELAIQAYRAALRLNPRMADACHNLGNLYLEKQQYPRAIACYEQALAARPTWDKALAALAQARALLAGEAEEAGAEDLDRVVDPQEDAPLLAALYEVARAVEHAGQQYGHVLEKEIGPAVQELARGLLAQGPASDFAGAAERYEAAADHLRRTQGKLLKRIARLRAMAEQFPEIADEEAPE